MKITTSMIIFGILGMTYAGLLSANLSFTEQGMTSDFNGDGHNEIVRIVRDDPGGSGTFYTLAVIDTDEKGELRLASALIGDRVQFLNFWKDKGTIAIDMVQAGEGDPACCPTHKVVRRWQFKDGKLMEQPVESYGQVSLQDLVRLKWQLVQMDDQKIAEDAGISFSFFQGDKISGRSGCNSFTGTVKEPSTGKLKIQDPLAATMMACPEKQMDLEKAFLNRLTQVNGYRWMGDYLELDWQEKGKQGGLIFKLIAE